MDAAHTVNSGPVFWSESAETAGVGEARLTFRGGRRWKMQPACERRVRQRVCGTSAAPLWSFGKYPPPPKPHHNSVNHSPITSTPCPAPCSTRLVYTLIAARRATPRAFGLCVNLLFIHLTRDVFQNRVRGISQITSSAVGEGGEWARVSWWRWANVSGSANFFRFF